VILNIVIFIVVLGILVLIHELGHFIAAKKSGMIVEEFAIGYPPRLFHIKKNGTKYSINLFPLGGFVKIKGEHYDEDDKNKKDPKLFYNQPLGKRIIVVIAGVFMNLIFGWLILWIGFSVGFPSLTRDLSQVPGAEVMKQDVVVAQVNEGEPADVAGIEAGSVLVSSGQTQFKIIEDVQEFTKNNKGQEVIFTIKNIDGQLEDVTVNLLSEKDTSLGVVVIPDNVVKFAPHQAIWQAIVETGQIIGLTGQAIIDLIGDLFFRGQISEQISGPVGIYRVTAQAADVGFTAVILIACILSINLALINLVPFPALDGG